MVSIVYAGVVGAGECRAACAVSARRGSMVLFKLLTDGARRTSQGRAKQSRKTIKMRLCKKPYLRDVS
ncbi:MAG: hypothetical protein LBK99_26150 [Opitutaceae bacterium]|jgi:hypothetical protein|nr:hypothetical protein [Opitutaceae bacterium]